MATIREVEDAAQSWVASVTGLPTIWAEQNATRPSETFLTLRLGAHSYGGQDEQYPLEVTGAADAQTLGTRLPVVKQRNSTLTVQSYGAGPEVLEGLRDSVRLPSRRGLFTEFAVYRTGDVIDITALLGGQKRYERRFQLDVFINSRGIVDDDPGLIERVVIAPTYARSHGDPAPVARPPLDIASE